MVDDENLHAFRLRLQLQSQPLFYRRKKRRTGSCRLSRLYQFRWQAGSADARLFLGVRGPVEIEGIVTSSPVLSTTVRPRRCDNSPSAMLREFPASSGRLLPYA